MNNIQSQKDTSGKYVFFKLKFGLLLSTPVYASWHMTSHISEQEVHDAGRRINRFGCIFFGKSGCRYVDPRNCCCCLGGGGIGVTLWTWRSRVHILSWILSVVWRSVGRLIVTVNTFPPNTYRCWLVRHPPLPYSCIVNNTSHSYHMTRPCCHRYSAWFATLIQYLSLFFFRAQVYFGLHLTI